MAVKRQQSTVNSNNQTALSSRVGWVLAAIAIGIVSGPLVWASLIQSNTVPERPTVLSVRSSSEQPAKKQLPSAATTKKLTFIAVGDIMLSRDVAKKMKSKGFDYPFAATTSYLRSADFAFGNLETSITPGPVIQTNQMTFRADPGAELALRRAGFQVLSLANNHTPNFGQSGLLSTFKYLHGAGIKYCGAGKNSIEAHQPVVIEKNGLKIAFLAYNDTDVVPPSYGAGTNRAGTALMDIGQLQKDVGAIKSKVDVVIVSMHSGTEYTSSPNDRQKKFARAAIDAGAELIIGHHPHVVQTIETYKGKLIIYSLGNFVFDQMWSTDTRHGLSARIDIDENGVKQASFTPVQINDYAQPVLLTGSAAVSTLRRLGSNATDKPFIWSRRTPATR